MRIHLMSFLLIVTTFTAAAQTPVKVVTHYPTVYPSAEIHFMDGNVSNYPIKRISKDLIRVETSGDQSIRMPLTYVDRIKFNDGCTLFFENGQFRFDKLVQPAFLKNESGDVLLEGVLQLSTAQAESLLGPDAYLEFRKDKRILRAGEITLFTGGAMMLPYVGLAIASLPREDYGLADVYKSFSPTMKGITIGGGCLILAGVVVAIIGNSGCNRVLATYNNGLGVAYTF